MPGQRGKSESRTVTGPDTLSLVPHSLKVGHQEGVSANRDAFRFLWFDTVPGSQSNNIVEWRMTRVPFGSTSSPFLLMATIHHHLDTVSEEDKTLAFILKKAFYVDDLLVGAGTFKEGLDFYKRSKAIMNDASINLRK